MTKPQSAVGYALGGCLTVSLCMASAIAQQAPDEVVLRGPYRAAVLSRAERRRPDARHRSTRQYAPPLGRAADEADLLAGGARRCS
jgi:hypothetical protein